MQFLLWRILIKKAIIFNRGRIKVQLETCEITEKKRLAMHADMLWTEEISSCLNGRPKLEDK